MVMEAMSGFSLADVVVHRNSAEPARLGAAAFTKGNQIHVAPGQERHLPHEAWHVVQQKQGRVRPTRQLAAGIGVNDDAALECEADAMGIRARSFTLRSPPRELRAGAPAVAAANGAGAIQRTEADAVAAANRLVGAQAAAAAAVPPVPFPFASWAHLVAARRVAAGAVATNWDEIAAAYTRAGTVFAGTQAMIAEATRMFNDPRPWSDPQARREAENILQQMATAKAGLLKQLPAAPVPLAQRPFYQAVTLQIAALQTEIDRIQTKYLMAIRTKQVTSWYQSKKPTLLELPDQAGELALHNKVNPDTGKTQNLGTGGAGYGRFGKLGGHTRFVKKQKLKKNEQTEAAAINNTPLYAQGQAIQDQNLAWIHEEMVKFRAELNVTTNLLNHANVVRSYGGAIGIGKGGAPKAYIVMEMMAGGDLTKVIGNPAIDDVRKKAIMLGAINGLAHVHAARLIHRDIKPENIMLDSAGVPKLIDFGEAVTMDGNNEFVTRVKAGTAGYYHPDIVRDAAANQPLHYSAATDLYALGKTFEKLAPVTPALTAWIAGLLAANDAAAQAAALAAINIPPPVAHGGAGPGDGGGGPGLP
jgi:hypothetical protein